MSMVAQMAAAALIGGALCVVPAILVLGWLGDRADSRRLSDE